MGIEFKPYPFVAERYPAHLPACSDGVDTQRHRVAIVGGGPVGLAVALGLANHGIRSVLLEADDSVCHGSRAICISRRSLEIIERLGALDDFLRVGLPWTGGRSFYRRDEVLHFTMPQDENQKLPPMVNLRRGAVVDIHHTILPPTSRHSPDPARIIERAAPAPGLPGIRVPSPEDLLIHSITHLVHEGELHNGLRDLVDIDTMLRGFPAHEGFWQRFTEAVAQHGLAQPVAFGLALAQRFFAPQEVQALRALPAADRALAFLQLWTLKEALLKAEGRGLAYGLHRVVVELGESAPVLREFGDESLASWQLQELSLGPDWVSAIAWHGPPMRLRWRGGFG